MGFVKQAANIGTFGLAGKLFGGSKKKQQPLPPQPTMISTDARERPMSLIGTRRY